MQHRYSTWTEGLNQDWCISRQRYFGVPFPVWYKVDENGNIDYNQIILPTEDQLPIDPMADVPNGYTEAQRNQPNGFAGDPDVMDTWATSSLTPQIAMAMAKDNSNLSLPFDVRPQAHDIIRTWAFYTIAKSLMHENTIPWYKTLISGFILDPDRKKMSKSKGNVVTPMHLIENHSADAVRYWAAKAKLGADTAFEEKMMQQGRKLVVKMYNASKFVFMIVGENVSPDYTKDITNTLDKSWIKKLANTYKSAKQSFENYDYSLALDAIETRFWDFCDNYVEIVKKRAYSEDNASAIATLKLSLDTFVKLLAPFCPFITEEIYQARGWKKASETSVHKELWSSMDNLNDFASDDSLLYDSISAISTEIRKQKTIENKSQKNPVLSLVVNATEETISCLKSNDADLVNVGNIIENGVIYKQAEELLVEDIKLDQEFVPEKKKVC
jgi:valyl-tRNA synthetase